VPEAISGENVVGAAVKVLSGPVVTHRRARIDVPGSNLDIPQVHARVKHVATKEG
jgi:hypothetical protein